MWFAIFLAVVTASQLRPACATMECATVEKDGTDICQLSKDDGSGELQVIRYYYNNAEDRCLLFLYKGCNGNTNNFDSKHKCERACLKTKNIKAKVDIGSKLAAASGNGDACQLPMDAGICNDGILRYYYNSSDNKCHIFNFGGCFGNANNFWTKLECEKACLKPENGDLSDFNVVSDLSFAAISE